VIPLVAVAVILAEISPGQQLDDDEEEEQQQKNMQISRIRSSDENNFLELLYIWVVSTVPATT